MYLHLFMSTVCTSSLLISVIVKLSKYGVVLLNSNAGIVEDHPESYQLSN